MKTLAERCQEELSRLDQTGRLRRLPNTQKPWKIDLSHNDYLGLNQDAKWQARLHSATRNESFGGLASRLLGVSTSAFEDLEFEFARFKGAPAALYFGSGYAANEAVITVLANRHCALFSDQFNHASIIDGIRLSVVAKERRHVFRHNDLADLEAKLAASDAETNLIVTESLFSMDGDYAPLQELAQLADRYRGMLIIDEAHAIGICGPEGRGLVAQAQLDQKNLITINTCGKAMGLQGALVCGPQWVKDIIVNKGRSFIYTTAPSPILARALVESIPHLRSLDDDRDRVKANAQEMRQWLQQAGFDTGLSQSHIIPVIVGSDSNAVAAAASLAQRSIRTLPIRPPTVAEGKSRLRLSLHAALSTAQLDEIKQAFEELRS